MRGFGSVTGLADESRWMRINQLMRDEKIGVLALQETHLNEERVVALNELFGRHMHVVYSALPGQATGACGVAFALNKRYVDPEKCALKVAVEGRAISLTLPWATERTLRVLNVYGPNVPAQNADFWTGLRQADVGAVDMLVGDFNVVEEGMDRIPAKQDPVQATEALRELIEALRLHDGWRAENPNTKEYTYLHKATGAQSRLDRIYITGRLRCDSADWKHKESGLDTDHKLVTVSLANRRAPFMGKGRWAMPIHLLTDPIMIRMMRALASKLISEIGAMGVRTEERNPQMMYRDFKIALTSGARARAKEKVPKLQKRLENLREDLKTTLNPGEEMACAGGEEVGMQRHAAILQDRIALLEQKLFAGRRRAVASKHWVQTETMSKYWTRPNVAPLPSTVIPELRMSDREEGGYTTNSKQMAEVARAHYDGLQNVDPMGEDEPHDEYIAEALAPATVRLRNDQKAYLAQKLVADEVTEAINEAANNKAPGLDGLPSEVWKTYLRWHAADVKKGAPALDMAKALACVFNNVAAHGMIAGSEFAEGWICPIYKLKKDLREIVNYRPITLLNSDYKIMTKALAMKLAECAPSVIHTDQAGFVPGRRIFDHVQLSKLIIAYTEAEEINGAIVALDQEKAYDRIDHHYLWATLEHLNFPANFVNTVRHLYANAVSCVIVNGMKSRSYKVWRGVRQGDPMSCLLFDFAIEPLACALRASTLRGILIPGDAERLIATLFADDTTVFLGEGDDYATALIPTDIWCRAARARFNLEKTEVIPLGTQEHRAQVLATRCLHQGAAPIPDNVHIVADGEAVRSLGAWIGNHAEAAAPWNAMIATMRKNLEHWNRGKPTLLGRKLAVDLEVGGRTQFLAKAQGMPKMAEDTITRMIANFMWSGDVHPRIDRGTLYAPVVQGGLNVLNVGARNDAIDLMRLKDYLNLTKERPRWALVADVLLARAVAASSKATEPKARINSFLQTWEVSTRHAKGLPEDLRRMIKVAKKFGVRCDVRVATRELKEVMPAWYHLGSEPGRSTANSVAAKCLRRAHGVCTVGECERVAARLRPENEEHEPRSDCECCECEMDRSEGECSNPHRCAVAAERLLDKLRPKWSLAQVEDTDGLSLTRSRKRANETARAEKGRIVFDPSLTQGAPLAAVFRVFTDISRDAGEIATRPPRPFGVLQEETEVYTDGSSTQNGAASAKAGSGVWFGPNDTRNEGARVPYDEQTNQAAEIYAVVLAERKVPPFAPLHIVSDSKYVVDGLTVNLRGWENKGWIGVANVGPFCEAAAALRSRSAITTLRWVKGHSNVCGNEEADKLASKGAELPRPFRPVALPRIRYLRNGAALATLTQSLAYRGVKRACPAKARRATEVSIAEIVEAAVGASGIEPSAGGVWCALRRDPVSRPIRDFLWKTIHGAQKVGTYWKHIPGFEERAICEACGATEDMKHILTSCCVPGQNLVWRVVIKMLSRKGIAVPPISLGLALGGPLFVVHTEDGGVDQGATRAARLLLSEAVHVIWVLRCERVIGWTDTPTRKHTDSEIVNRFAAKLNRRIALDQGATNVRMHRKRAVKVAKVQNTWKGLLREEHTLPEDWMGMQGVLVGIPTLAEMREPG
ncbi:LINE-1 retrotransposable element ORF2 protein [Trametes pubescens]|uniref:LINE-1 retrotransposable element ORF2 protein n=1 Tax=Trametes pubescens TaxID=154538 RepID=A0A1M2VL35_TRAPU|nr:LINE-1 retrotransposable element ORF2 protein [Trametes pubescens]